MEAQHKLIRETDHPYYAIYETTSFGTLHISLLLYDGLGWGGLGTHVVLVFDIFGGFEELINGALLNHSKFDVGWLAETYRKDIDRIYCRGPRIALFMDEDPEDYYNILERYYLDIQELCIDTIFTPAWNSLWSTLLACTPIPSSIVRLILFPYISDLFHLSSELETIKKWKNNH